MWILKEMWVLWLLYGRQKAWILLGPWVIRYLWDLSASSNTSPSHCSFSRLSEGYVGSVHAMGSEEYVDCIGDVGCNGCMESWAFWQKCGSSRSSGLKWMYLLCHSCGFSVDYVSSMVFVSCFPFVWPYDSSHAHIRAFLNFCKHFRASIIVCVLPRELLNFYDVMWAPLSEYNIVWAYVSLWARLRPLSVLLEASVTLPYLVSQSSRQHPWDNAKSYQVIWVSIVESSVAECLGCLTFFRSRTPNLKVGGSIPHVITSASLEFHLCV